MRFSAAAQQSIGKRKRQEDSLRISRPAKDGALLCILSDGMGGHSGGNIASAIVVEKFDDAFAAARGAVKHRMKRAIDTANDAIAERAAHDQGLHGMGATLVAAYFEKDELHWASVGDSHLYFHVDGVLQKLNEDHSMAPILDGMAADGKITQQDALSDPQRNALRSALSGDAIELIDFGKIVIQPGEYLLASDGLDTLNADEIISLIANNEPNGAEPLSRNIVAAVDNKNRDRQDNTSIITVAASEHGLRKKFLGLF